MGNGVCSGTLNSFKSGDIFYRVSVTTGNFARAGTDADISMTIVGTQGRFKTPVLDKWFHDDFEKGNTDRYGVYNKSVGDVLLIKIHVDERGFYPDWFVDMVKVEWFMDKKWAVKAPETGKSVSFPVFEWVGNGQWLASGDGQLVDLMNPDDSKLPVRKSAREEELYIRSCLYNWRLKPGEMDPGHDLQNFYLFKTDEKFRIL